MNRQIGARKEENTQYTQDTWKHAKKKTGKHDKVNPKKKRLERGVFK